MGCTQGGAHKGVHLSQVHQQSKKCTNQGIAPTVLLVQLRQLHPLKCTNQPKSAPTNQRIAPTALLVQLRQMHPLKCTNQPKSAPTNQRIAPTALLVQLRQLHPLRCTNQAENTPTITNKTNETYNMAKFKRILLKLSGESLMGKQSFGIDPVRLGEYAEQIKEVHEMGVQIGIVIGGGNIFRGLSGASKGFDRVKGDQMGMCATVINSLALSSALGALGVKTKVLTAIRMEPIGEFYSKWKAIEAMEAGYVCIFSAGTGSPYFTTDTGSSLRGIEIEADVMLKGTRVDGIYTADPEKDPTATKFTDITYDEIYTRGLKVMDLTATTMCKENNLPIYVFNMDIVGNLRKVMQGEEIGTLVHN